MHQKTTKQAILFTSSTLTALEKPEKGFKTYHDTKCPYLKIYVTANGAKTFYVERKMNGKAKRLSIGSFPLFSIEQARKQAIALYVMMVSGINPHTAKEEERQNTLTLGQHFQDYMERHSKIRKRSWKYDETEVKYHLSHWFGRRLSDITKDDIQRLHERIGTKNGIHAANSTLKRLSAIFNKAIEWGWIGVNPTLGIKKYKTHSRDRFIQSHEMPFFLSALNQEENDTFRDFFMVLLLTGVRKTNALQMRYTDIIWDQCAWRIPQTKNGDPLLIPLVDEVIGILKKRNETSKSEWVFPQDGNSKKHIATPIKPWRNLLARSTLGAWQEDKYTLRWITAASEKFPSYLSDAIKAERLLVIAQKRGKFLKGNLMDLRLHDLRRTFGSYQALTGASLPIIGRSLGHKSPQSTMIYARLNLDPIREAICKATASMLKK